MAFDIRGWAVIDASISVGTSGGSIATARYATNDDAATVQAAGYFNVLAPKMRVGDVIQASLDLDGTPMFKIYMVTSIVAGVVTIGLQTVT